MKSKNRDYIRFFKPCMIVAVILIVVSAVFLALCGFNKGFDFTGGRQLVVEFELTNVNIENDEELDNASKDVKSILSDYGARINSFQTKGEYGSKSFVITIRPIADETMDSIRVDINKKFNTSSEFAVLVANEEESDIIGKGADITRQSTNIDGLIENGVLLTTIASLLFSAVLLTVYACFRISTAGALSMLIGVLLSVIGTLCFVTLTRIEINTYIFAISGLIMLVSVISSADLFFNIKDKLKDDAYASYTTYDIANLVVDKTWTRNLIKYVFAFVVTIVIGALTVPNLLHLSLVTFAGLVVCLALNTFVVPAFYAIFNTKRTKIMAQKVEENSKDKDAEVIEIKE